MKKRAVLKFEGRPVAQIALCTDGDVGHVSLGQDHDPAISDVRYWIEAECDTCKDAVDLDQSELTRGRIVCGFCKTLLTDVTMLWVRFEGPWNWAAQMAAPMVTESR